MTESRVMIVTGGSRGIGAATARLAAQRGYDVCVNYLGNAEGAQAVVREVEGAGRRGLAVQGDMAQEEDVERLFETADRELGTLGALVNNAGLTGPASRLDAVEAETLRRVLDVNVLGVLLCSRAAVRRMSTRHGGKGGGIVNISSVAASLGMGGDYVWYATSKGAIDSLTIGLANEVAREGIRVNAVAPGLTLTDIHVAAGDPTRPERLGPSVPIGRAGTPEEIAEPILWLLSEAASYTTGAILRVGGGR
jgi:NAD(P)-dependent dehydrogenase (short-subunit alcohol dehydrogenase family)